MKKTSIYIYQAVLLILISSFIAGCGTSSGTRIDQNDVSKIKKGVTTKAEVELLLGPPISTTYLGNGRSIMHYNYSEMDSYALQTMSMGALGGGMPEVRMQSLQVIFTKSGVVEDYTYSDGMNPGGGSHDLRTASTGHPADTQVKSVQKCLNNRGYEAGREDGVMGKKTREAIKLYQQDHNLPATGRIDAATKKLLVTCD